MEKFFRLLPVLVILALGVAWLFPLAALGTKFGWWHFRTAFSLMGGAAFTGAVLLALAGVAMLMAIARKNQKAKHRAVLISVIVLLPLGFVFYFGVKAGQVPEIHDISTDRDNPPGFSQLLTQRPEDANPLAYTPEIAAIQARAYPQVQPLFLPVSVSDATRMSKRAAKELNWNVVNVNPDTGNVEATDTSFWFGFVDDIVVRIQADKDQSRIDVRSVSRLGRSDVGKNAARIEAFLVLMQSQQLSQ